MTRPSVFFAYRFDRAVMSRDGEYAVLYEALGTKGLIVHGNKHVREINRSYYHAHVYEYPTTLFNLSDGRIALAHCPDTYNRLEFEEIESGKRLTERPGESPDFFHSRLEVSPSGAFLLSAGWVWHPLDVAEVYAISNVLNTPEVLDRPLSIQVPDEIFEVHAAAFQENDELLIVGGGESEEGPHCAGIYSLQRGEIAVKSTLAAVPGTIMPVGRDHFVGFYEHPKLFEVSTGRVIFSWPDLKTGKQNSSIMWHELRPPPIALDPRRQRFAVASEKEINVIELGLKE